MLVAIAGAGSKMDGKRDRGSHRTFHGELTEMTNGVERTRALIVEESSAAESQGSAARPDNDPAQVAQAAPDMFAAVERIRSIVSTLRERNLDAASCEGIEALASVILSTSSLRDPSDHRTSKLAEAIDLLERRVETLLEARAQIEQPHAGNQQASQSGLSELADATAPASPAVEPPVVPRPTVESLGRSEAEMSAKPTAETIPAPAAATSLLPRRSRPAQRPAGRDPLAALAAMTEEELIALFS